MDPNLERARTELKAASDEASRVVETQLHSLDEGIFEEEEGRRTEDDPGPKIDRIAEMYDKLQGLQAEAEGETAERIAEAREYLRAYMKDHPQGGDVQSSTR